MAFYFLDHESTLVQRPVIWIYKFLASLLVCQFHHPANVCC